MITTILSWVAVGLLLAASIGLLLSRDWRWSIGLLAAQYFGMFWLVSLHWPFGLASVKLVTGWMACAALGVTRLSIAERESGDESAWPQGRLFRTFAAAIVVVLILAAVPSVENIIPGIGRPVLAGGLLLVGMGLLQLGITAEILRVTLGLLTVLAGFEIVYSVIESSILLAGLLSIVSLGLALAGSYLMTASQPEETT
jgi:hypothetical protein